jgi:hypothetical protein
VDEIFQERLLHDDIRVHYLNLSEGCQQGKGATFFFVVCQTLCSCKKIVFNALFTALMNSPTALPSPRSPRTGFTTDFLFTLDFAA